MPMLRAKVTKVEHDLGTGWYRITTDHGDVKRLDTKKQELAEQAARLKESGVTAEIDYTERPRTVDGRTYRNFYWENGEAAGDGSSAAGGIEEIGGQDGQSFQRRKHPDERWQIALQGGMHAAIATLPFLAPDQRSFDHQKRIATAWAVFLFHSSLDNAQEAVPTRGIDWEPQGDPGPENRPSPQDDDIPFEA